MNDDTTQTGKPNPGAAPFDTPENDDVPTTPPLTNAEVVQLQVRVIALENLVIALLAESSEVQRELAREMAAYILPRPGFTRHPLTIHASGHMLHLVERAGLFAASSD
ncbi:MAG: hypothetical protein ABI281_13870 [Caldimonas sp.]